MVVTLLPATAETGITQERIASPSRCTVHAPHCASPQPKCGLVIFRSPRSAYRSGMPGSALIVTARPSTENLMRAMKPPLGRPRTRAAKFGVATRSAAPAAVVRYAVDSAKGTAGGEGERARDGDRPGTLQAAPLCRGIATGGRARRASRRR